MSLLHLLEPEESIGNLWHALVGAGSTVPHYPNAAVGAEKCRPKLSDQLLGAALLRSKPSGEVPVEPRLVSGGVAVMPISA
jgi:hypothetical protein